MLGDVKKMQNKYTIKDLEFERGDKNKFIIKKELFIPLLALILMVLESILLLFLKMSILNLLIGIIFF